uniref:Uncharacterized protein n=1 Tax=Lepeophtheirus salmonis TaxID=72036 RepID=A0A0K2TKC9_LEPSM
MRRKVFTASANYNKRSGVRQSPLVEDTTAL